MGKTISKSTQYFVVVHTLAWLCYLLYDGLVGVHDMNFGMVLTMLVLFMDFPSVWVMKSLSLGHSMIIVFLLGTAQWYVMGLIAGVGYHRFVVAKRPERSNNAVDAAGDPLAH